MRITRLTTVLLLLAAFAPVVHPQARVNKPQLARQVRSEFLHAWNGYKKYAWGHDDLKPLSRAYHDRYAQSLLMTPVDALDTMILMGLKDEAKRTREYIDKNLSFDKDIEVQNFEITIRLLGGLLSNYQLTGDKHLLDLAEDATGEKDVPVKSAYAFAVTKTFTDTSNKITTASAYNTDAANYDLDAANFATALDKTLTSDDQVRVMFSLIGDQGTDEKAPLKAGTYLAKADKFMKVETVGIVSRKGGADNKVWLDRGTLTGEVKLTSASADEISGDIDVTSGDTSIKGSLTAKILKRK